MTEPTLSTRALNRALLARQLLLERADLSIPSALEKVGGLQDQYAPSAYIGLWSRLQAFGREQLTKALEDRKAVQGTLMRSTIHLVSARDYHLLAEGTRQARRDLWLRAQRHQVTPNMEEVAARVQEHLEGGPRRQDELIKLLQSDGFSRVAWSGARLWLDMVRVPPSGTWNQRRADLHGLASAWLPPSEATSGEGLKHLLRRYLGGFGPAPLADAASWAGVPLSALGAAMQGFTLRRFRDESGRELLDLPGARLPDPDTPAPVRFLPTWDASLLVHARRTQVLPEAYRPMVFNTRTPHSVPTFLVDGAVAGTWRYEHGRVQLTAFASLDRSSKRELQDEAERLAAFHSDRSDK